MKKEGEMRFKKKGTQHTNKAKEIPNTMEKQFTKSPEIQVQGEMDRFSPIYKSNIEN